MIYDDHFFAIEDQLDHVVAAIRTSSLFQTYQQAKVQLHQSATAQQCAAEFLQAKEQFEQIERFGKFAPDYKEKQRALRKAKRALDVQEEVAEFRFSENDMQAVLDEICLAVAHQISDEIKVDAGSPFFTTKSGCGGNCHVS